MKIAHSLRAAILVAAFFLTLIPGFAQENKLPIVSSVAVENRGSIPIQMDQVLSYVSEEYEGNELDSTTIAADIKNLLKTRLYSYAASRAVPQSDGTVQLVFVVEARFRLAAPIDVLGNDRFSRGRIRKFSGLAAGDPIDDAILQAAATKIRTEYTTRRYPDATITPVLIPVPETPGLANARFEITEGARVKIPLIRFEGNTALSDRTLRRHTNQAPWWDPYTHFFKSTHLDSYDLQIVRSDARAQYADLGYLDAAIEGPFVDETNGVRRIHYTVNEGTQYTIGAIALQGNKLFPNARLLAISRLRAGDIASQAALDDAAKAIRDFYGAQGYVDTHVRLAVTPDETRPGIVNLRYSIKEGALLRVRSVIIQGQSKTRDKVIRREITLNPGDVYNDVDANRSDRRLENLGYFSSVRHYDLATDDPAFRDVVYEVDEKSTGQFLIGAGFSSVDHLIGFAEISQNNFDLFNWPNFSGGGQKIRLGVQASGDYTNANLSFVEPWFLDRYFTRLSLDVDLFLNNHAYNEYDEQRVGGSIGLSRHVPWVGRLGLSLNAEKVALDDLLQGDYTYLDDPAHLYRYTDENDDYFLGSLKFSWLYDTRNRPFVPTRGTRASIASSYYGSALGSETDMLSLNAQWRTYIPVIYSHVLSLQVRGDTIDALNSDDVVPIGSRYFLGGGRNVRGFRNRAIGPKVAPTADNTTDGSRYRPVGGQTRIQASAEYSIPLSKWLRFGAFYDIGNVWEDAYEADFSDYAASYGAGLRLDFPGFPIRFDYAYPVQKDDECTRTQRWVFWVGFE